MRGIVAVGGLLVALGIGYFLYNRSLTTAGGTRTPPQQQIDVIDIRTNLMNIGQAERMYLAAHGTYGTLEQLREDAPALPTENRGYVFNVEPDGARSFRATATPVDPDKSGWPTLVINETLTVAEQ